MFAHIFWRRQWHPTPVLLSGKSHGQRSLEGHSPWGHRWGSDTTKWLHFHFHAMEKEIATHSSVLAWRIPGTGEPGGLLSMGSHRVGHDWSDLAAVLLSTLGSAPTWAFIGGVPIRVPSNVGCEGFQVHGYSPSNPGHPHSLLFWPMRMFEFCFHQVWNKTHASMLAATNALAKQK